MSGSVPFLNLVTDNNYKEILCRLLNALNVVRQLRAISSSVQNVDRLLILNVQMRIVILAYVICILINTNSVQNAAEKWYCNYLLIYKI